MPAAGALRVGARLVAAFADGFGALAGAAGDSTGLAIVGGGEGAGAGVSAAIRAPFVLGAGATAASPEAGFCRHNITDSVSILLPTCLHVNHHLTDPIPTKRRDFAPS